MVFKHALHQISAYAKMISSKWKHLLSLISGIWKCQNEPHLLSPRRVLITCRRMILSHPQAHAVAMPVDQRGRAAVAGLLPRCCVGFAFEQKISSPILCCVDSRFWLYLICEIFRALKELLPHSCSLVALNNCSSHLLPLRISWPPRLPTSTPFPSFPFPASMSHVQTACRSQNL